MLRSSIGIWRPSLACLRGFIMQIVELKEIAAATEQAIAEDVEKWVQDFCERTGLHMEGVEIKLAEDSTVDSVIPEYRATAHLRIRLW